VIPRWLALAIALAVAAGVALGALTGPSVPERVLRAVFYGAASGYAGASLVDFWEHFRLEKQATGRWLAATAIPIGESLNHLLTIAVLISMFVLARPPASPPAARDFWIMLAPGAFLALGWRDEIVYHRRRAAHREDIMHTVAHLAAGAMLTAFYALRLVRW